MEQATVNKSGYIQKIAKLLSNIFKIQYDQSKSDRLGKGIGLSLLFIALHICYLILVNIELVFNSFLPSGRFFYPLMSLMLVGSIFYLRYVSRRAWPLFSWEKVSKVSRRSIAIQKTVAMIIGFIIMFLVIFSGSVNAWHIIIVTLAIRELLLTKKKMVHLKKQKQEIKIASSVGNDSEITLGEGENNLKVYE